MLLQPAGDEPEVVPGHEQCEQDHRQRDSHRQRFYRTLAPPLVVDEEVERREEAADNEDEEQYDDDFHERFSVAQANCSWPPCPPAINSILASPPRWLPQREIGRAHV